MFAHTSDPEEECTENLMWTMRGYFNDLGNATIIQQWQENCHQLLEESGDFLFSFSFIIEDTDCGKSKDSTYHKKTEKWKLLTETQGQLLLYSCLVTRQEYNNSCC